MPVIDLFLAVFLAQSAAAVPSGEQGASLYRQGRYEEAAKLLEKLPESPLQRVFLGLSYAATGRCADSEPLLSPPAPAADLRKLATLGRVSCLIAQGRHDEALPLTAALRREFPDDADVLYQAARLHMRAWNSLVRDLFERAPSSYRVQQLSAEIFELEGKFAEAVAEYRKAIAKEPGAVNLHYRLGRALLMESSDPARLEAARNEFESELRLNPRDAVAEYQVAQILQVKGEAATAAQRFAKALTLKPDFVEAMVALAKLDRTRAVELLERAVTLQPSNEAARYQLVLAYRNAGRAADAERAKAALDKLQRPAEGEFSDFLKRIGEKKPQ